MFRIVSRLRSTPKHALHTCSSSVQLRRRALSSYYEAVEARIRYLLGSKQPDTELRRDPIAILNQVIQSTPKWNTDAKFFWNLDGWKNHQLKNFLVSSLQVDDLPCWLHAPVVLQHYLVVKGSGVADHTKVAICKFAQLNRPASWIYDRGGNSFRALTGLTRNTWLDVHLSIFNISSMQSDAERIAEMFDRFGPGLVAHFHADKNFHPRNVSSYLGNHVEMTTFEITNHSMVLIGYRRDPWYGLVFLLQNWWKDMEFVEVSAKYMARTRAIIYFVTEPLTSIPPNLETINAACTVAFDGGGGDIPLREKCS